MQSMEEYSTHGILQNTLVDHLEVKVQLSEQDYHLLVLAVISVAQLGFQLVWINHLEGGGGGKIA